MGRRRANARMRFDSPAASGRPIALAPAAGIQHAMHVLEGGHVIDVFTPHARTTAEPAGGHDQGSRLTTYTNVKRCLSCVHPAAMLGAGPVGALLRADSATRF